MYQLPLWDEGPSDEAVKKAQDIFKPFARRKKRINQIFNCLFWILVFILFSVLCALMLFAWNQVI